VKILIIEDDPKTAAFLTQGFREQGFVADTADNGADGLHLAMTGSYDVIVLDVMLPQQDGWTVLRQLLQAGRDTPVLLLTALDAVSHRVQGLELGADDYLVKPFAFSELLARVRTILRRGPGRQLDVLRVADLEMDCRRHQSARAGQRLDLAPQEFRLLEYFLRHPGEVLARTLIAEQVWDMNFDSDSNAVDVAVRRLRRKVDDAHEKKLIHTVRGVGYVLEERD